MFIRVNWNGHLNYSVYECSKYVVNLAQQSDGPDYVLLVMSTEAGEREVAISNENVAFVMNDQGKTIDTIRVN